MAPHSSTLAWKIPWTEEPGGLQCMGSRRVGHDWAISLSLFTFLNWRRKWQPTPVFLPGKSHGERNLAGYSPAKSLQQCPTLCDPIDGSPPGSPIPGILQARTLEWVAISFSNAWKWKVKSESEVAQSCPTLRDPMDCSPPGSSVHGIFQTRVLEWGAITFSVLLSYTDTNTQTQKQY